MTGRTAVGAERGAAWVWVSLVLTGLAVYATTMDHPFVYDDLHSIKYNPHIRELSGIPRFFTDPHTFSTLRAGYMFRPVLMASYAVNYWLGGQNPYGYRAVNLAIHLLCSGLCFHLAWRLAGSLRVGAALGAAFLLHPAHAEVVNYISARSDGLVAVLYLAALVLALGQGRARRGLSHLAYTLGLLVKSVAITVPVLLWLWDLKGRRNWLKALQQQLTLGVLAVAYVAVLWLNDFLASAAQKAPRGILDNLWTQAKALVYYPFLFAMPTDLSVEHAFEESAFGQGMTPLLCVVLLASVSAVALWQAHLGLVRRAWLWYLVALAPYAVAPLNILVGERRAYLASGGLLLVAAWAWAELHTRRPRLARGWGAAVLLCLGVLTVQRNQVWSSEVGLWEDAVARAPANARVQLNLALAYKRTGRIDDALVHLRRGLVINPVYADAWVALGDIHMSRGDAAAARSAFERALALNPDQAGVYHNLGNLRMRDGDPAGAVALYEVALAQDSLFVEARNNLGQALEAVGEPERAMEAYEQAIADSLYWTNTDDPVAGAWYNLARLCEATGRTDRAVAAYTRAYEGLRPHLRFRAFAESAREAGARLQAGGGTR